VWVFIREEFGMILVFWCREINIGYFVWCRYGVKWIYISVDLYSPVGVMIFSVEVMYNL